MYSLLLVLSFLLGIIALSFALACLLQKLDELNAHYDFENDEPTTENQNTGLEENDNQETK